MKSVTTTEAKTRLNALLVQVRAGESVTITSHGRPVAILAPVEAPQRSFGQLTAVVRVRDDFDAPLSQDDLAQWGESK